MLRTWQPLFAQVHGEQVSLGKEHQENRTLDILNLIGCIGSSIACVKENGNFTISIPPATAVIGMKPYLFHLNDLQTHPLAPTVCANNGRFRIRFFSKKQIRQNVTA